MVSDGSPHQAAAKDQEEAAQAGGGRQRQKRKGSLEESLGSAYSSGGSAATGKEEKVQETTQVQQKQVKTLEAALDLNSILRGKKVRVVSGEDEVADCYALCVRVLQRSKVRGSRQAHLELHF